MSGHAAGQTAPLEVREWLGEAGDEACLEICEIGGRVVARADIDDYATADLFAAAPEILAACELALRRAKSDLHFLPSLDRLANHVERQSLSAFIKTLESAISKAKGGSP